MTLRRSEEWWREFRRLPLTSPKGASVNIAGRFIGREHPAYLIAEIGGNHGGKWKRAAALIRSAAAAGADAVKLQSYRPEYLVAADAKPYWASTVVTQAEYFRATATFDPAVWKCLAEVASENGVAFLLSAFDEELVDLLDPLVPAWKVASGDITHEALIRRIASKGKPILLSTGASTLPEIQRAVSWCEGLPICLMHCCLSYPAQARETNLSAIRTLAQAFPQAVMGWSDHVVDRSVVPAAYILGASIVEKHFTSDRDCEGPDHRHSWDRLSLEADRKAVDEYREILGDGVKVVMQRESAARRGARRSLHTVNGEQRMLRPAF